MKKITSLILALVMALSLTVTALAADKSPVVISDLSKADVTSIQIPAKYEKTATDADIAATYYVYMDWSVTSELKYVVDKDSYTWTVYSDSTGTTKIDSATANTRPESAKYNVRGHWDTSDASKATVTVNVENWSNKDVKVAYKLEGAGVGGAVTEAVTFKKDFGLPTASKVLATKAAVDTAGDLITAADVEKSNVNFDITANDIATGAINDNVNIIATLTVTIEKVA